MGREHLQARGTAVPGLPARAGAFSTLAGCVSVLVGSLVLVGWSLDIGVLKRILPNLVAMNPVTAVCFVLAGVSLYLLRTEVAARGARGLAAGLASAVCLVGLVKLAQVAFGWEAGIDGLLFPRGPQRGAGCGLGGYTHGRGEGEGSERGRGCPDAEPRAVRDDPPRVPGSQRIAAPSKRNAGAADR
jgi:hypothetical protein